MGCNKCNETPNCTKLSPCGDCRVLLNSSCLTYDGEDLTCLGIESNEELNTVLQTIAERACESSSGQTNLVNIGSGEELYAGVNELGQRQIKTIVDSDSIIVTSTDEEVTIEVSPNWVGGSVGEILFPENIVEFNTANPNIGSPVFNPNTPTDEDALYWSSVNYSQWKYNGSGYVTAPSSANATPFNLGDTTIDAGGNKTAPITRRGAIGIGIPGAPQEMLDVFGRIRQSAATSSLLKADAQGNIVEAQPGVDYLPINGNASQLTNFPTLNQNTTGQAATVVTNANLNGDVTSIGNTTTLGDTGVVSGTYEHARIEVNSQGRVVSISTQPAIKTLADFYSTVQNIGSTTTNIYSYTIPPSTLNTNGDKLEIEYAGKFINSSSKSLGISFGGVNQGFTSLTSVGDYVMNISVIRENNTQGRIAIKLIREKVETSVIVINFTLSLGWASNNPVYLTAQGSSTGDILVLMGSIKYYPAAV